MGLRYKNGDDVSDSVGLLISILVRYPEVGSIHFEPDKNVIKFSFFLLSLIPDSVVQIFKDRLSSCIKTFFYLHNSEYTVLSIEDFVYEGLTLLEIKRDVESLTSSELSLIVQVARDAFEQQLAADQNESLQEEDLLVQEELIGRMLDNVRYTVPDKRLIAFREEGRVLVFNK